LWLIPLQTANISYNPSLAQEYRSTVKVMACRVELIEKTTACSFVFCHSWSC